MLKIIGRTLVILATALVVAGATFAFAGTSSAAGPNGGFPARGAFEQRPGNTAGEFGRGDAPGGFDHEREGSAGFFGATEIIKNLIIIGVIVAIVAPLAHLLRRRRPGAQFGGPQSPSGLDTAV